MRAELRRAFTSKSFLLEIAVFMLCYGGYALPTFYRQWLSPWAEPPAYRENALYLTLGGIFFGGVMLLLPFCASISSAPGQVDDLRTGMIHHYMIRGSFRKYAEVKLTSAFCSSAAAAGIAFILHALLWHAVAEPFVFAADDAPFWKDSLLYQWSQICHGLPIFVEVTCGLVLTAGVWSVVAMTTAVWIPDKLLTVTIPAGICKIWAINSFSIQIGGVFLPGPETLYNDGQTLQSDLICLAMYAVVLCLAIALYMVGLKRRAYHA